MAPSAQAQRRSHSVLLLQKLLNMRDGASPLTLVLDNLEQAASPVVDQFVSRAKIAKCKVVLLSFATIRKPRGVDVLIKAWGRDLAAVRAEVMAQYPPSAAGKGHPSQRVLLVIDSLNSLATAAPQFLSAFLSAIISSAVSVVAVWHTDVPIVLPANRNEYEPDHLTVLTHLATAILRVFSLEQEVERQKARDRSVQEPEWGLNEGREGVIIGLRSRELRNDGFGSAVVLEMELRKRSGRAVTERFVLSGAEEGGTPRIALLEDHPAFKRKDDGEAVSGDGTAEAPASTFELGLTEKQRRDREGIVLPYFDAQTEIGAGEGGRILYEMGREDDFDDEEDEI